MNYLYNGVELPELPEWDKEVFPYAVIHNTLGILSLTLCKHRPYAHIHEGNGSLQIMSNGSEPKSGDVLTYEIKDGVWELIWTSFSYLIVAEADMIWCNADIYYDDKAGGELYRATSDPVPVGGEPIDKASFMQGYIVGRRLAGMRK